MSATFRLAAWTPLLAEAATFYPALGRGYFDEAGLDLRWLAADGSPAALDLIERDQADAAFVSCYAFLRAVARGAPVVGVYNLYPRSCFAIFGPTSAGITRPRDLAGRRVGLRSTASSGAAWLRLLLRLDGLSGDEATARVVGDDGVRELLAGGVDALVGSDAVLYDARRAGLVAPFTFWLDDALPMPSDLIAVRADRLAELIGRLRAFLGAYQRGLADAVRHPSWAAEMIARHAVDGQDGRRNRAMLALRLPLASPRPGGRAGWFDPAELEAAGRTLATHGLLARPIDPAGCFTNDVVAGLESSARWAT